MNEAKTDTELHVQYKQREVEGKELAQQRLYEKEERALEDRIKFLEE